MASDVDQAPAGRHIAPPARSRLALIDGPTTARIDPAPGQIAERLRVSSTSAAADANELWLMELDGSVAEFKKT
jgi:hypothetical protein